MSTNYNIIRQTDRSWINAFRKIATHFQGQCSVYLSFPSPAEQLTLNIDQLKNDPDLKSVLAKDAFILLSGQLRAPSGHVILNVSRYGDQVFDSVTIEDNWRNDVGNNASAIREVVGSVRDEFTPSSPQVTNLPGEKVTVAAAHHEILSKLQGLNQELTLKIHDEFEALTKAKRQQIEDIESLKAVEKANAEAYRKTLDEEYLAKKKTLDDRIAEVDLKAAKINRRQLRIDLLKELEARRGTFELTAGTGKKRAPIRQACFGAFLVFVGILASSILITGLYAFKGVTLSEWQWGLLYLGKFLGVAGIVGLIWFYIKWEDRWFREHADAEFRYRNMELDVNWSNWIAEFASEWTSEKEGRNDLPKELLEVLSRGLFQQHLDTGRGKADDPVSTLLNASTEGHIEMPNGFKLRLNKSGLQNLAKARSEATESTT